jgi:hypothetical protein
MHYPLQASATLDSISTGPQGASFATADGSALDIRPCIDGRHLLQHSCCGAANQIYSWIAQMQGDFAALQRLLVIEL